ncbi:MAG: TolC family protein [candidate division KSB1 bacterium]|nr:TolC family protein [candidate division KSB1 bacterium]
MIRLILTVSLILLPSLLMADEVIDLTLDRAVQIAMGSSYRIKQLKLGIERSRLWLQAERAGLRSKVYMNMKAPEFEALSDYEWDSNLQKDIIVRRNTQLWQANLAIRQPIIFFGYPTNGYLSLNNKVYRYDQITSDVRDINYYNRLFVKYEQPFFQPNELKNDIEKAQLSLERKELQFLDDQVDLIDDIADDFYDLYRLSFQNMIFNQQIINLEKCYDIADCRSASGEESLDCIKVRVELNNVKEKLAQNKSNLRMEKTRLKQRLRLESGDSLVIKTAVEISNIAINPEEAVQNGFKLRPRLRLIDISKNEQEINLINVKGWNSFRLNLEMTFGLERQNPRYEELIRQDYENSYSVALSAYMPIWDWGQRRARIQAQKISIQKYDLYKEEIQNSIRSEIENSVQNMKEYQIPEPQICTATVKWQKRSLNAH